MCLGRWETLTNRARERESERKRARDGERKKGLVREEACERENKIYRTIKGNGEKSFLNR